jgi:uncharacterized protein (TIGR02246 family)
MAAILAITSLRPVPNRADAADPKSPSSGEAEIRQAEKEYIAALNASNLDAIMAFWAVDADFIDEAGTLTTGKEALTALFKKSLPDRKGSKYAGKTHSLKFLRPEVALEDGTLEVTDADGTKESSRYAVVWTKTGDKWLIASARDLPTEVTDVPSLAAVQLKDLSWMIGEWADDSPNVDVTIKVSWATNRAFLLMDYVVKRDGVDPNDVSVRIGWDALGGRIRSWTFDSNGGFGEGIWTKEGNKWLVGTVGVLPDGGTGGSTNIYEFVDDNRFVWRSVDRDVDGQPLADVEVKFVRKPAKK